MVILHSDSEDVQSDWKYSVPLKFNLCLFKLGHGERPLPGHHGEGGLHQRPRPQVPISGTCRHDEDELLADGDRQVQPELRHPRSELYQLMSNSHQLSSRVCPKHIRIVKVLLRTGFFTFHDEDAIAIHIIPMQMSNTVKPGYNKLLIDKNSIITNRYLNHFSAHIKPVITNSGYNKQKCPVPCWSSSPSLTVTNFPNFAVFKS
jgi:hypothetical protein